MAATVILLGMLVRACNRSTREVTILKALGPPLDDAGAFNPTCYVRLKNWFNDDPLTLDIDDAIYIPDSEVIPVQVLGEGSFHMFQNGMFHVNYGTKGVVFECEGKTYVGEMGTIRR